MLCENCKHSMGTSKEVQRNQEDTIRFIAQNYSTTEILRVLGVTYEDLKQAKADYESNISDELKGLFKSNLIDRYDSIPFKLNDCIDNLGLPYKSSISFKRMLANGTMPLDHINQVIEYINQDYRPKNFK